MSAILLPLWLVLGAGAAALAVRAVRAARRDPSAPAPRTLLAAIPIAALGLALAATTVLGISPASDGASRQSAPEAKDTDDRAPARARLFLRQVRIDTPVTRVGYSPDADLVLPSLYGLTESVRAWDLIDVEHGDDVVSLSERPRPEETKTRLRFLAVPNALDSKALTKLARGCSDSAAAEPASGSTVAVALCRGSAPRAVLTFEASGGALLLSASVWRRGRLEPHHIEIEPEALIQIGAASAAVPGVTIWEVPAPANRSELFAAPADLLGDCAAFHSSIYAGANQKPGVHASQADSATCVVPFAPPFALEVRRLRPDVAGVSARVIWASAILLLPLFAWALVLFFRRRSESTRGESADLLRFAFLSVAICAVFAARLLWSHRIDMLRDWEATGVRTAGNLVSVVAVFAALALAATLAVLRNRNHRIAGAAIAFSSAVIVGWVTAPSALPSPTTQTLGQLALAVAFGSITLWRQSATRLFDEAPTKVVVAIAAASIATHLIAPRAVALKLLLCTAAIVAAYRALRHGLSEPGVRRLTISVLCTISMVAALAVLDTGLAAVIAVPGFFVALAIAGHDALFGAKALTEVKAYRLRQAPLLWLQGGLLAALGTLVLAWALIGLVSSTSPSLARDLTRGAPHLLWVVAALFAAPALVAHRRGESRTALLFGSAAILVASTWFFRDILAEVVLSSSAPAAQRYAVIADPGYALLADPRAFLSGITGWAETIFAARESATIGSGFFGAQLIDPGVLLSVENDYLPILILRELGILGMTLWAMTSLGAVIIAWLLGRELTGAAGPEARGRLAVVVVLILLVVYQPLASLGALPLTGVSWLGLGIDSPSDLWMLLGVLGYLTAAGKSATDASDSRHERALRQTRRFLRKERWVAAAAAITAIAGILVVARASAFAVNRPMPVAESGVASAPFVGLENALDYARSLRCTVDEDGRLRVTANPTDDGTRRYHRRLLAASEGRTMSVDDKHRQGLVTLTIRDAGDALLPTCDVTLERRALAALRVAPNRPYRESRIRLVSEPMGRAAGDHGELISGDIAIRLRASADDLALPQAPGLYAGRSVSLGDNIVVTAGSNGEVRLERSRGASASDHWLFVAKDRGPAIGIRPTSDRSGWRPLRELGDGKAVALTRDALIVVGRGSSRNVWLFRSPRVAGPRNPLEPGRRRVGSLLADDARSVTGARRRLYIYGNDLPELGWVNPFRARGSVGLDGWVGAALAEWNPDAPSPKLSCGTLEPPAQTISDVCSADPAEGVIECRIALQPELAIRMRHLTEMVAAAPNDFAAADPNKPWPRPLRASFMLLRGDTGEIAAQGAFVPGRASAAYAPTTAALETHLIRLREDRDPETGAKLDPGNRGEASAEKVEHNRPLAVGSVFKPMLSRAFEQTAPTLSRRLWLSGAPTVGARCRGGRHAIFGHCPPTDSLWNQRRALGVAGFIGNSANWFMAAVAILGTSLPDGELGLGEGPAIGLEELLERNVGDHATDWALWTKNEDQTVIAAKGRIDIAALRKTPMWKRFEAIIGRPLCDSGNKAGCERRAQRRDVCAARGLPISRPGSDLRQLVALGPDRFDFYPRLKNRERRLKTVQTREYLQFLRGSGVHPLGSVAQITDAFNRVIYEAGRDPLRDGPYRLAASWFPSAAVGELPRRHCGMSLGENTVAGGVCEVVRSGTAARALRGLLSDPRIEVYGAKTGTVDSLGDVAMRKKSCEQFRQAHTLTDRRQTEESQPYWLGCGSRAETDDSLLVVSFAVKTSAGGRIPFTLGIAFQRSGSGFASRTATHYIDLVADYFSAGEEGLP